MGTYCSLHTHTEVDFVFIRKYVCPFALLTVTSDHAFKKKLISSYELGKQKSPWRAGAAGDSRMPLTLRPLLWERTPKNPARRRKVITTEGCWCAIEIDVLLGQVCIVPDFKRGDGCFLVNDLIHPAAEELQYWADH